ncbi:nitrate- and nitrite sensing domain-containing protein [Actinomadura algeriensis]|uniref:histidine kinase n=1 Tax=Actinomadura algeriensis TaxID=1679523 RepID=A0ABR9K3X5_9ACTN|nr:nitrate- and nitrite sensing domain-containing protein [Actinomadura algeriensis]MBE1537544.1 signal transduction histidine kinase [Actinomadura algeriensis]
MPQRLIALILLPTIAAVALAGVRISSSVSEAGAYGRVERMAELGVGITRFVQEFTAERDLAVEYSAAGRPGVLLPDLEAQQKRTDAQLEPVRRAAVAIDGSYGAEAVGDARAVLSRLDGVTALRSLVVGSKVPAFIVLQKYTEATEEMIGVLDGISQNVADGALAESSRALGALARAKEAVSRERALLLVGARVGGLAPNEMTALTAARAQEDSELASFRASASVEQNQLYEDTVVGAEVDQARVLRQRVISAVEVTNGPLGRTLGSARSAEVIRPAMTSMIDKMRQVEQDLAQDIKAQSDAGGADARQSMLIDVITVVVLLALVLLLTVVMARSLVRPLRRLQSGALEIAGSRLPGLVERLRDPEAAAGGIEVEPIDVDSRDEIGQVARAFDEVHREAVRLAADEAVLRGNINAMFVNLSRRSQSLIERQLRLIEELEQSERDEEQLANLFRLDHLATRMRRNNENLLVLGGQEQVRRWRKPVPLIDVVRASLSEVEQYERVSLRVQGDMTVAGPAVNDLVHLLAELVENATTFSSEHTKVTVSGQLLSGGGSMLQITDNGVGMAPEELEQANWRLVNPPVIDFGAARRMGLFVVGRLAIRHGVRVELRAAQGGGLTAFVVLPDAVVSAGESGGIGARGLPGREAAEQGPLATLTAPAEAPAIGTTGAFQPDDAGTTGMPALGTGPGGNGGSHPMVGGTGPLRPLRGATGPQPTMNDSGPFGAPGGTGAHAARPGTGPLPRVPANEPSRHPSERPTEEWRPDDDEPTRRPGELPVRQPGAQLPGRPGDDGGANGLFEPRNEQPEQRHERPDEPGPDAFGRPGGEPVVPEAQPMVPEPRSARHIPWETGPLDQLGEQYGEHTGGPADATIADGSLNGAAQGAERGWAGSGWGETGDRAPAEPARPDVPASYGFAGRQVEDVPAEPAREPSMFDRPAQIPAAPPQGAAGPPQAPPAPPQAQAGPPRMPERSPIFDAMQSEWFQRRSGETVNEDPVKGWESPADAGFRAAEAARQPVAEKRTSVGLPKRVPGKNRVPGAVGKPGGTMQPPTVPTADPTAGHPPQRPQAAPAQGVQGQGAQGQDAPAQGRPEEQQGLGQAADVRRNRFASLQRGVNRGRTETRGGGTSGEAPSQDDGETGGTR